MPLSLEQEFTLTVMKRQIDQTCEDLINHRLNLHMEILETERQIKEETYWVQQTNEALLNSDNPNKMQLNKTRITLNQSIARKRDHVAYMTHTLDEVCVQIHRLESKGFGK